MMKKLWSILLVLAMLLTMVGVMTSCGGDEVETPDTGDVSESTDTPAENDQPVFPEELSNIEALPISSLNLVGTTWDFAGGLVDGVEMTQENAQTFLTGTGGSFRFAFPEEGKVQGIAGTNNEVGTYEAVGEDYFIQMTFNKITYIAAFTMTGDTVTMIAVNNVEKNTALYLTVAEG